MKIHVHIDHLVIENPLAGVGRGEVVKEALQLELGRMLAERGVGSGVPPSSRRRIDAGTIAQIPDAGAFGRSIARAVYGGIRQANGASRQKGGIR